MAKLSDVDGKIEQNPLKLSVKDKRIIGELFRDARTPFSIIAKRVRLSKESVNYRVKRLEKLGLLVGFNTVLDIKKIGWEIFFVYIRFRNVDAEKEKEMLEYLKNHPNVAQLFRCIGNYDAIIKVFVRNYADIDKVLKEIEGQYREFFDEYFFDYIIEEIAVPFSFLYQPGKESMIYRSAREKTEKTSLTELELRVLKELAKNARCSISEVAEKLKISRELIKYHLKKLEKSEVILKYRPDTLPKKLGYNWHFLILKTEKLEGNINKSLTTFLLNHPNVTYFYRTAGSSDIQVELRTKTNEKLNEILMEIRGILKTVLKRFELLVILDELKYTYFPECLLEAKGKS